MNLAIFLNIKFYYDGHEYTADERYFEFWSGLSVYFDQIILCVPVLETGSKKGNFGVRVSNQKISICHLPYYENSMALYSRAVKILSEVKKTIRQNIAEWDIIGAVVPNIVGLLFLIEAKRQSKHSFAYVRGNHLKTVRFEFKRGKKWLLLPFAVALDAATKWFVKDRLTFVVGKELHHKFRSQGCQVKQIVVSLVSKNDVRCTPGLVRRPCAGNTIRIVHVGRLSAERGVCFLIEALAILNDEGIRRYVLTIIGSGPEEVALRELVRSLDLEGSVRFAGYISYGPEMIAALDESDLFVLPSLTEGVPKVLIEAMANGLPVIASEVGGIPEIVRNGVEGILVPPGKPDAIAAAVRRMASDELLREMLVRNGLRRAGEFTVERQRAKVLDAILSYCRSDYASRER